MLHPINTQMQSCVHDMHYIKTKPKNAFDIMHVNIMFVIGQKIQKDLILYQPQIDWKI